jgi:hypothetical protein
MKLQKQVSNSQATPYSFDNFTPKIGTLDTKE